MIEVERLSKRYGRVTAVDGLSFTVRPGHVTGFLGPNGAGKTTTMRVILGLDAPTSGSVLVGEHRYRTMDPPVLMFDEPVNGLDPEGVVWLRQLLRSLAAEGRTVFVSSHMMTEMALTADHLIIIGRGRLLADTPTDRFTIASTQADVLVRSPRASDLAGLLTGRGAAVEADGSGGLTVTGMDAPAIADLAAEHAIPVHELVPRRASLEQAYLELTSGSTEYRAASPAEEASP
jgi:ABC-2 type transport system ATP-binding protein